MNIKFRGLFLFFGLSLVSSIFGEEPKPKQGLIFVGSFEKADIRSNVHGARKTQLAAAYTWEYGVQLFTDESWAEKSEIHKKVNVDFWEAFANEAALLADKLAAEIKPEYVRGSGGVIEYAIVSSDNAYISSTITSPKFVDSFVDTLGDKLHIVVLDRNVIYVFPSVGSRLTDFGPSLVELFKKTPKPVSLEVFEVVRSGFRVIGEIESAPQEVEIERGQLIIETRK